MTMRKHPCVELSIRRLTNAAPPGEAALITSLETTLLVTSNCHLAWCLRSVICPDRCNGNRNHHSNISPAGNAFIQYPTTSHPLTHGELTDAEKGTCTGLPSLLSGKNITVVPWITSSNVPSSLFVFRSRLYKILIRCLGHTAGNHIGLFV